MSSDIKGFDVTKDVMLGTADNKIEVELVKERKGVILKHVEYLVSSSGKHCNQVPRRYNDFLALYELLLSRYPYRLVPRLPPQRVVAMVAAADSDFLETRRRALRRWLMIVTAHPVVGEDLMIKHFLTFTGADYSTTLREQFRPLPDEYVSGSVGYHDSVHVTGETTTAHSQITFLQVHTIKLVQVAEAMAGRASCAGSDLMTISEELASLAKESTLTSLSSSMDNSSSGWSATHKSLKQASEKLPSISVLWSKHSETLDLRTVEALKLMQDVLTAHQDLVERCPKTLAMDHKKGLEKMANVDKRKLKGILSTDPSVLDALENRITKNHDQLHDLGMRRAFMDHCLLKETETVFQFTGLLKEAIIGICETEIDLTNDLKNYWSLALSAIK